MTEKKILFYFRKEDYGWLSNFWRFKQANNGFIFETNEHFYQSQKANDSRIWKWIKDAPNPFLAMEAGRSLRKNKELIDGWDDRKVEIMLKGLRAKFSQSKMLREALLETGNATIHENSPTDMFWGIKGEDMLGKLLMKVREELKNG